jgi:hypothetical protein
MLINDPNGNPVEILADGRMRTYASTQPEIAYYSLKGGTAYLWTASIDVGADKNVIWLKNDSLVQSLVIDKIQISCSAAATIEVFMGTGSTTGGTAVTPVVLNSTYSKPAPATCRHTNTNVDAGSGLSIVSTHQLGAVTKEEISYNSALQLALNYEIAVNVVTDIALTSVNILGYFHPLV